MNIRVTLRSRILFALRNRKDRAGNKIYRYVWSREGRIYCRKESESPANKITCPNDLGKLGWSPSEIQEIAMVKKY